MCPSSVLAPPGVRSVFVRCSCSECQTSTPGRGAAGRETTTTKCIENSCKHTKCIENGGKMQRNQKDREHKKRRNQKDRKLVVFCCAGRRCCVVGRRCCVVGRCCCVVGRCLRDGAAARGPRGLRDAGRCGVRRPGSGCRLAAAAAPLAGQAAVPPAG